MMNPGKPVKLVAIFMAVVLGLAMGRGSVESAQNCRGGMVFVPGGVFQAGISDEEYEYVLHLCNMTVGNCYGYWFEQELPEREVKYNSFCMDQYEYPNQEGEYPQTGVSFAQAKKLCARQGKRLCRRTEWEAACEDGTKGYVWSYGHVHRQGVCNDYSTGLLPSGYKRNCVSGSGAVDMNGNVAEWVEGEVTSVNAGVVERYNVLKGGSFRQRPIFTRCTAVDYQPPDRAHADFGFRCCEDTNTQKARRGEPVH